MSFYNQLSLNDLLPENTRVIQSSFSILTGFQLGCWRNYSGLFGFKFLCIELQKVKWKAPFSTSFILIKKKLLGVCEPHEWLLKRLCIFLLSGSRTIKGQSWWACFSMENMRRLQLSSIFWEPGEFSHSRSFSIKRDSSSSKHIFGEKKIVKCWLKI